MDVAGFQMNVTAVPATKVPEAVEMFPPVPQAQIPSQMMVNWQLPTAVALHPTGVLMVATEVVPVMWNSGPDGVIVDADAIVVVGTDDTGTRGLLNPGTHVFVTDEHNH